MLLFAATLFLSSLLMFALEPIVAKTVLPILGGTPMVWNTCVLFFQILLLGGYAYAHGVTTWLGSRWFAAAYGAVLDLSARGNNGNCDQGGQQKKTVHYSIVRRGINQNQCVLAGFLSYPARGCRAN